MLEEGYHHRLGLGGLHCESFRPIHTPNAHLMTANLVVGVETSDLSEHNQKLSKTHRLLISDRWPLLVLICTLAGSMPTL